MNSEQKEQNIQVPELPDNSNQNIMLVKSWQIKSWQILLLGIIIQFLILNIVGNKSTFLRNIFIDGVLGSDNNTVGKVMLFIYYIYYSFVIGLVLVPFLYFNRTKKIGSIFCILFGLIKTAIGSLFFLVIEPIGIFSLIAGIYYFWKKV